jgi:amino acid transporter
MWLGIILGAMLLGLAAVIRKFDVTPDGNVTVLAELTKIGVGGGALFYIIQIITLILLVLAANTSFGGLPVLASIVAEDNFLPHFFHLKAERQVHRYGVGVLAVFAAVLLIVSRGDTQALIPLFAIGVFVGFTLAETGMVRHWHAEHKPGWMRRAAINGLGAVLTFAVIIIELEGEDASRRLVVLIAELEPMRAWQWILHNQRGAVLERAVRHDTTNVVVCRIRFQPTTWSAN